MHTKKPGSSSKGADRGDGLPPICASDLGEGEDTTGKGSGRKVSLGLGLFKESSASQKEKERRDKERLRDADKDRPGEDEVVRSKSRGVTLLDIAEGLSPQHAKTSLPSTSPQDSGLPPSPKSPARPSLQRRLSRRSSHRSRRPTIVAPSLDPAASDGPDAAISLGPVVLPSPRMVTSPLLGTRPALASTQTGLSDLTCIPMSPDGSTAATVYGGPFSPSGPSRAVSPSTSDPFSLPVQMASSSEEDEWTDSYGSSSFESSTADEDESDSTSGGLVSSFFGGRGAGTPPRATVGGGQHDDQASGDEHDDEWDNDLPTIPLMPFRNQVGGHSAIYKFTKRAVCKVSLVGSVIFRL